MDSPPSPIRAGYTCVTNVSLRLLPCNHDNVMQRSSENFGEFQSGYKDEAFLRSVATWNMHRESLSPSSLIQDIPDFS